MAEVRAVPPFRRENAEKMRQGGLLRRRAEEAAAAVNID
jgi:hypothetical protein